MAKTPKEKRRSRFKWRRRLQKRREYLLDQIEERNKRIRKLKRELNNDVPDTDEKREQMADRIDALAGEKRKLRREIERVDVKLGKVKAAIRELGRIIRRNAQRLRRRRYWASKHFRFDEFDCNDGTPVPKAAYPALRHLCREYLEPQRAQFGACHINSGYRHEAYNRAIGGASDSVHIYDNHPDAVAADQQYSKGNPGEVANWAEKHTDPDGMGRYATFIHQDNRNRIGWPDSRWTG